MMVKFSVTLLLLCFLAAVCSTQAQELPFAKFCGEQESDCLKTCDDDIKEFGCNAVTGITTTACTCKGGKAAPTVDPPPAPPANDDYIAIDDYIDEASDQPATPAGEPAAPTEAATPTDATAPPAAPSSAVRTAGSVVALGFVAAGMML